MSVECVMLVRPTLVIPVQHEAFERQNVPAAIHVQNIEVS
jgi:hypothetical protein